MAATATAKTSKRNKGMASHNIAAHTSVDPQAVTFTATKAEWLHAIGFGLLMAVAGLEFYPALLLLVLWLVNTFRTNRYAFLLEFTIFLGGYGFISPNMLPLKMADVALVCGVIGAIIYRKNAEVKRITIASVLYIAMVIAIAMTSDEPMRTQFIVMRNYFYFLYLFVPLIVFANRRFVWQEFIHTVMLYALVICGFYAVDTYLLSGFVLVPACGHVVDSFGTVYRSTIHNLWLSPASLSWPRHYPNGLYWLSLCILAITTRQIRLSRKQWLVVALGILSTRTFSLLASLLVCFAAFRSNAKQVLRYALISLVVLIGLYGADHLLGGYLRVASTIDQFTSLNTAQDAEDLAEFGTGRMAQIIPKWELLTDLNRRTLGFGFLHPELTTNPKYQIKNDLYTDIAHSDEVATAVEVTQIQTILDIGFLGLLIQTAFFIWLYRIIRRLKHARVYACVLTAVSVLGIGGFAGLTQREGLFLVGITLGAILAYNKQPDPDEDSPHTV